MTPTPDEIEVVLVEMERNIKSVKPASQYRAVIPGCDALRLIAALRVALRQRNDYECNYRRSARVDKEDSVLDICNAEILKALRGEQ